jgi:hypothetical protein
VVVADGCAVLRLIYWVIGDIICPKITKNMIGPIWISKCLIDWTLKISTVLRAKLVLNLKFFRVVSTCGSFATICIMDRVGQAIC